jgi:hypothetical protein
MHKKQEKNTHKKKHKKQTNKKEELNISEIASFTMHMIHEIL